jgi:DNA repair protein RecO (recombination protein O)
MFNTTNALVLREVRYKEADRILTLLTSTDGKITVKARGALRKGSKITAATQQLTYSEMNLFGNLGKWTVNEAVIKEPFTGLREDIELYALGCYFAECLESLSVEDQPDSELLQLGLNSLYALSHRMYSPEHIKAVFELRLMCLAGYTPELSACPVCGCQDIEQPMLSLQRGAVYCRNCSDSNDRLARLCPDSLSAMRYIISAPPKRLFSFQLSEEALSRLGSAAERYLLLHTERQFPTLTYWKNIRIKL